MLVVDDQVVFRGGLVRLLESQPDMKVVGEAGALREAVDQAHALRPDVILMDLGLPDGSGLGATLAILAEMPDTRIVFLTVHDDDEDLFAAIRAGAKGYILKSVSVPDLFSQLRGVMRGEAAISPAIARRILGEFSRIPSTSRAELPETSKLTARELEVVRALAQGATNREIAEQLAVSENTVRTHVHNVLAKLHLHSRRDLTNYARAHGLSFSSGDPNM
jgi:DNA-binding NarL/FixJ family response regulator